MNSSLVDQDNGLQLCLAWSDCDTHHYPGQICSHKLEPLSHDPVLVQRGRQKKYEKTAFCNMRVWIVNGIIDGVFWMVLNIFWAPWGGCECMEVQQ